MPNAVAIKTTSSLSICSIISFASYLQSGSISVFNFSYNLQSVPLGIIGLSYAVAAFPMLTRSFADGKLEEFKTYITIPIIVAHPITKDMRGFYMLISKGK